MYRWSGKRSMSCLYYATDLYEFEVRTECLEVRIEESGETFYTIGDGAVCLAHSDGTKSLYDEIAVAYTAQDIPSDCIAGVSNSRYSCASLLGANLAD